MKAKKTMENLPQKEHDLDQITVSITSKNFRYYLAPQTSEPQLIPQSEFRLAFVDGYIYALHKTHTITESPFCILNPEDIVDRVKEEVSTVIPPIARTKPNLKTDIHEYLHVDDELIHRSSINLPNAFISGYLTGLYKSYKYDRCLFMEGQELRSQIFADLFTFEEKEKNVRYAALRISRAMLFDNTKINDNGENVTK